MSVHFATFTTQVIKNTFIQLGAVPWNLTWQRLIDSKHQKLCQFSPSPLHQFQRSINKNRGKNNITIVLDQREERVDTPLLVNKQNVRLPVPSKVSVESLTRLILNLLATQPFFKLSAWYHTWADYFWISPSKWRFRQTWKSVTSILI